MSSEYYGHELAIYLDGFTAGYLQREKDLQRSKENEFDPTGQIAASRMERAKQEGMLREPFIDSDEFEPTTKGPAEPNA